MYTPHNHSRRDGQILFFASSKSKRLFKEGIKPAKLTWTLAWRRLHKKDKKEEMGKTRKRRIVRVARAVVGMSLDDMMKKKKENPKVREEQRAAALQAAKEKAKKEKAAKASTKKTTAGAPPTQQKQVQKGSHNKAR